MSARSSATPRSPNALNAVAPCASCSIPSASPSRARASTATTVAPRRTRIPAPRRGPPLTPEVRRPPRLRIRRLLRPKDRQAPVRPKDPVPPGPRRRNPRRARPRVLRGPTGVFATHAGIPQALGYPHRLISLPFCGPMSQGTLHTVAGERARRVRPSSPTEGVPRVRSRPTPPARLRPGHSRTIPTRSPGRAHHLSPRRPRLLAVSPPAAHRRGGHPPRSRRGTVRQGASGYHDRACHCGRPRRGPLPFV